MAPPKRVADAGFVIKFASKGEPGVRCGQAWHVLRDKSGPAVLPQVQRALGGNRELRHHARREMGHVVTMEHPARGFACVQRNRHNAHRRYVHSITHSACDTFVADADDLEGMAMQVHRMCHHRHVVKHDLHPLA